MEDGQWSGTSVGTPQGAVASPLWANVCLHYVLDLWVQQWRGRNARGNVVIVRNADDFVMGFQHRHEAERFLNDAARARPKPTRTAAIADRCTIRKYTNATMAQNPASSSVAGSHSMTQSKSGTFSSLDASIASPRGGGHFSLPAGSITFFFTSSIFFTLSQPLSR